MRACGSLSLCVQYTMGMILVGTYQIDVKLITQLPALPEIGTAPCASECAELSAGLVMMVHSRLSCSKETGWLVPSAWLAGRVRSLHANATNEPSQH
jgi:hypothetical protein